MCRPSSPAAKDSNIGLHWFRKGLRLQDNPALLACLQNFPERIYPVYILDGNSYQLFRCSPLKANFLIECLQDLDANLRRLGSRLYVLDGDPTVVLPELWNQWNISYMSFEEDESGEPYATQRDAIIVQKAREAGIPLLTRASETLHPLRSYVIKANPKGVPNTMTEFTKLFYSMNPLNQVLPAPKNFPPCPDLDSPHHRPPSKPTDLPWPRGIPKSKVEPLWGPQDCQNLTPLVRGGETRGRHALRNALEDADWVATFEKPETSCTTIKPSTTGLSPYLSWGCLSPREVWVAIETAIAKATTQTKHSRPPQSLHGQLLWRDFNNLMAHDANNEVPGSWNQMKGNKHCRQIPWDNPSKPEWLEAWKKGRTGYPWIDACMRQLLQEGWMHHLGRHAVACFLTRGDLWQSWEEGAKHFEGHLLDADYALNGFNWLWVSCSGFFYKFERCYSPIAFQKKKDPKGNYIRHYCPELKRLPNKYIYTPFDAPASVLARARVRLGENYPRPLVDHAVVREVNMERIQQAYAVHRIQQGRGRIETSTRGDAPTKQLPPKPQKDDKTQPQRNRNQQTTPPTKHASVDTPAMDPKLARIQELRKLEQERDQALTERASQRKETPKSNGKIKRKSKKSNGLDSRHLYL